MDNLDIELAFDAIGDALRKQGKTPDEVEEFLEFEARRVAQEQRDEADG